MIGVHIPLAKVFIVLRGTIHARAFKNFMLSSIHPHIDHLITVSRTINIHHIQPKININITIQSNDLIIIKFSSKLFKSMDVLQS